MKKAIGRIGDAENTGPIRGAWIRLFPVLKMIHRVLQFATNSLQSTNCSNNNKKERKISLAALITVYTYGLLIREI